MTTRFLTAALVAAAVVPAAAAHARTCAGTAQTYLVCVLPENVSVDPDGGPPVGDCVYLNQPTCTPIFVPTPSVTTTGPLVTIQCGTLTC